MDIEEQLKKRLGVPENWDKHDYDHGRYSFNDVLEIIEEVVKSNSVLGGVRLRYFQITYQINTQLAPKWATIRGSDFLDAEFNIKEKHPNWKNITLKGEVTNEA